MLVAVFQSILEMLVVRVSFILISKYAVNDEVLTVDGFESRLPTTDYILSY